jgi:hypothetical protein
VPIRVSTIRAAMKKWASPVGILFLVILPIVSSTHGYPDPGADKNKHSILGKWDSRIRSNGSGLTLEFLPDGRFREDADVEKEGRYELKDNHLTTYTWDVKESREKQRAFDLTLGGDHVTMKESNGPAEVHLERVCKSGSALDNILGEWFSPNYPGAINVFPAEMPLRFPAFVEFTRDKRMFFRSTPVKSTQGQYEFSDGTLLLRLPSEPPLKSKPRVSSDQTDIRIATRGPEIPFRRATGSDCAAKIVPSNQP